MKTPHPVRDNPLVVPPQGAPSHTCAHPVPPHLNNSNAGKERQEPSMFFSKTSLSQYEGLVETVALVQTATSNFPSLKGKLNIQLRPLHPVAHRM